MVILMYLKGALKPCAASINEKATSTKVISNRQFGAAMAYSTH